MRSGHASDGPSAEKIVTRFVSVPKPEPASATSFATSRSTPFAAQLLGGPLERPGLGREAHEDRRRDVGLPRDVAGRVLPSDDPADLGQDVGRRLQLERQALPAGQLRLGRMGRTEVGHGRGHDERVERGPAVGIGGHGGHEEGSPHLGGRTDMDDRRAFGQADAHGADDEGHVRPAIERGLGDRDAHLARGAVRDEPDRIDRLGRAAGGHDDAPAGEVRLSGHVSRSAVAMPGPASGPSGRPRPR